MSLSDCKYGSNTQTDHSCSPHGLPGPGSYGKRPVRTFFDFRDTNIPENLDAKWAPLPSLTNLWSISKIRLVIFLLGLTLMFLIMASYILSWDKKGLLFTPAPYQLRPVVIPTNTATAEVSSKKTLIDMKLLVKIISSKLDYTARKVPNKKDVIETDSHSPCWYEEFSGELGTNPYDRNLFAVRSKSFKTVCNHLGTDFQQRLYHRSGKQFRLRCLPYFYIIGQPKCGTTDLFHRLRLHPELKFNTMKEPHWWTRKRFGYIRFKDGFKETFPVEDYLDLFDLAAKNIQAGISGNSSGDYSALQLITGEASASTMWDNQACSYVHGDGEDTEPPFLAQDFIHSVQPSAKIIIILRDPAERLYSDYLYFTKANKSAEDFHLNVVESVQLFQSCLSERSLRSCVYNASLSNTMPAFNQLVSHFPAGPLSEQEQAAVTKPTKSNSRRAADRDLGPMLPATSDLLRKFHQPFNHKLASVLDNKAFLW
ncbi:hypothetical protein INR49_013288, partial [Caranx melampygus]